MLTRFFCWLGIHYWKLGVHVTRHGAALGNKCEACGIWHKFSVKIPAKEEDIPPSSP